MTEERDYVANASAALGDELSLVGRRFGNRRVDRMYAEINKLRQAIRSEGSEALQDAWDRVEERIDYAYGGCTICRATHAPEVR